MVKYVLAGFLFGSLFTIILLVFLSGVSDLIDTYKDTIIAIDDFKRWKMKRAKLEVSDDLKDIEEWMNREDVKDVIASKEFGVWLRHRVTAEIERKFEIAEHLKELNNVRD